MFLLRIETDNAAFHDDNEGRSEIARILRDAADRLENSSVHQWNLGDINGNSIGVAHLHP